MGTLLNHKVSELISKGVLVIGDGYRAKNDELSSDGLPFARAGNINGGFNFQDADKLPEDSLYRVGNKVSQPGDVVFTSKGTVGRFAFVGNQTQRFVYSPQLCFWRIHDNKVMDARFLYFWMHGREFYGQFKGVAGQTDMAEYVSLSDQRRMEITLPPLAEQRAIASVLGALDDKIESNRRTSRALERLARALFRAWFVDFEPVKAKAAGATTFPGMPQETFDSLPTRFVESELGPVPEGWEQPVSVAELERRGWLLIGDGYRAKRSELGSTGAPFIRAGNVNGTIQTNGVELLGPAAVAKAGAKRSRAWDTVFTSKGTVGRLGLVTPEMDVVVYAPQVCFWRSMDVHRLSPFLLYLWMKSERFTNQWMSVKGETDMADFVSLSDQRAMTMLVPPPLVQQTFDLTARPLIEKYGALQAECAKLAAMRDYLLPKLLRGEVRVGEAEAIMR